ncbi:hypothetical protein GLOIN_2v1779701 [Rhizophagus irregularis DAOM 181602=DAOM 197198]|uniref:Uncharacterized protein n=1 Tax=Rhizophagus irregularis (strain DAOM 181602 / DAOM 197198 / MUCL 43194) TaxID=747089 RepID=A0A2P4PP64_RHIID|nr:hypothetical protein GLOIN_2v1779701 [Rhizophagus irregularis DAOM 181602=DAOM 197198]POG67157.1 hypothetical protein GLOIN_2v1779701 [Rhizophagus irregularis DAOM 181602=DAOM 197198]|eukprot:XP_025174023.1 hypothetical protein GLOIN_2v1779701 [Rhizophagus irregularis DAOM 181602=DAOM 197198]
MSIRRVQFLNFWQDIFMDNKIVDINIFAEPKPDGYVMTVSGLDLQLDNFYNIRSCVFPFSFYFMKQIDNFKTLYEEEISLLRKNRENIGPSTRKLLEHINEDYIKEFINKDFVNIVCNSKSSSNNSSSNEIPSSSVCYHTAYSAHYFQ